METKARYLKYTDKICREENGQIINEDKLFEKMIMRFKNGLLHADEQAAVECIDGHREYWKNGKLHNEKGPAVFTIREDENGNVYEEYWLEGEQIHSLQ